MAGLLERSGELGRIGELVRAARDGDGGMLLIEGQAGIGKTELVEAARRQAREAGMQLASARGAELEAEFPFGVVRQLYEPVLAAASARDRRSLLGGAAAPAGALLHSSDTPPEHGTFTALHSLYWLTINLTNQGPLVITVDDVQWSDAQSLRYLAYLRPRLEGVPLLAVVGRRTGEPAPDPQLLEQLTGGVDRIARMHPAPLSPDAVATVVGDGLGTAPDPAFSAACATATGGNPFLVRELVNELLADETAPVDASAARVADLGSRSVARAILRRIDRLAPAAAALARALAVLGGEALLRDAAELAELEESEAGQAADLLVEADVIEPGRPLTFVHPLVRSAVYRDLPASRRAAAHARAAEILERHGAHGDAVAAHLLETEPAARSDVAARLRLAAHNALQRGAPEVSARYLRRALAEPPQVRDRAELLQALGAAELDAGRADAGAEHLAAALPLLASTPERVRTALLLRQGLSQSGQVAAAVRALDGVKSGAPEDLVRRLEAGAVSAILLDAEAAARWGDRALRMRACVRSQGSDDAFELAVAAAVGAYANCPAEEDVPLALDALARMDAVDESSWFPAYGYLGASLMVLERHEEAVLALTGAMARQRYRGSVPVLVSALAMRSRSYYRTGQLAEAEADARDAIERIGLYRQTAYTTLTYSACSDVLVEQGALDDADRLLGEAALDQRPPSHWYTMLARQARAKLRLAQGRPREALADIEYVAQRAECPALRSPSLSGWRSDAALVHLALGDAGRARELADEEVALARIFGTPRALGIALRAAALTREGEVQISGLAEAEAVLAGSSAALEHARTLADLGAALRRANRRAEAREPLRRALDTATRLGATAVAARARDELAATGARPRRARLSGVESLTASERRVAGLAAAGRSNVEIAQELFLTRRTVETHLTHAYQKLDISSRAELPGVLS